MSSVGPTLTIFDVDYTLFRTPANVLVWRSGKIKKRLSSVEWNTYQKKPNETYDFSEFRDASYFRATATPIVPVITKAKNIIAQLARNVDSRVLVMTARESFTNNTIFQEAFRDVGINTDKLQFEFAGDRNINPIHKAKAIIVREYLDSTSFYRARMFDDSTHNLDSFLELKEAYPNVHFESYLVTPQGRITSYS